MASTENGGLEENMVTDSLKLSDIGGLENN